MKKWIALALILVWITACAGPKMTYTPTPFTPPVKSPEYKLPPDPAAGIPAPEPIYLKKDAATGKYVICKKEEVELYAFTSKELNKITIRLDYYKNVLPQLENLVNIHIQREGVLIDLLVDKNVAKELFKELYVEMYNKNITDKNMFNMEKGGYIAVILGILIEMGILIAK
jgi:hypothetical protein